jgi:hypothetical protein
LRLRLTVTAAGWSRIARVQRRFSFGEKGAHHSGLWTVPCETDEHQSELISIFTHAEADVSRRAAPSRAFFAFRYMVDRDCPLYPN